ncbi:MAG: hypothetical protein QGI78_00560 [Phycisphaerales bacterium]|nr:hypothetical protein [Phycisphaerales bacterium]
MTKIVGQQAAVTTIQNALKHERNHHAWIFQGPAGVGKFAVAQEFARALITNEIQGVFQVDREEFQHPDFHVIRKEDAAWSKNPSLVRRKQTNIPVDLLRERMIGGRTSDDKTHDASAYKTSVGGGNKFFVIDEAELLDEVAQNALLKTLEEPPLGTFLVLVTSRDDLLLPTIRSRCQIAQFSTLQDEEMRQWLSHSAIEVPEEEAGWLLEYASGSPGDFVIAKDHGLFQLSQSIQHFIQGLGSGAPFPEATVRLLEFVDSYIKNQMKSNPLCSKEAANRRAFSIILRLLGLQIRRLLLGTKEQSLLAVRGAAILSDIESQIRTNISVKVLLESLVVRWTHLSRGEAMLMPVSS